MNRILITGGSGLLGCNLALRLRNYHKIYILLNNKKISIPQTIHNAEAKSIEDVFFSFSPDLVINTAAITDIELCESNPNIAKDLHVAFLNTIVSNCKNYNCKLIHISTDHLTSGISSMIKEGDLLEPVNEYGKSKLLSEKIIEKKLDNYLIIRTNFFGWGPKYRKSFSDRIINDLSQNKKIYLFKDVYFSPVSIYNLINLIIKLYQSNAIGVFNISSNNRLSKLDFGILLSNHFKLNSSLIMPSRIERQTHLTIRPKDTSLDNTKISRFLDINCGTVSENIGHLFLDIKDGIKAEILKL